MKMKFECVNGGYCTIINKKPYKQNILCEIIFDDIPNHKGTAYYQNLIKGVIKNPWKPTVNSVGYLGKQYKNDICKTIAYKCWTNMLNRCYNISNTKYKFYGAKGVIVCEEWLCFANYEKWFNDNYYEIPNQTMVIDKDILYKNNKIYSPSTCIVVPQNINKLFCKSNAIRGELPIGITYNAKRNVYMAHMYANNKHKYLGWANNPQDAFVLYKIAKEQHIKEMADKYREYLPQKVYDAMYAYEVEITD